MESFKDIDINFYINNLDEAQKTDVLHLILGYSAYMFSKETPYSTKISEAKFLKIIFEIITGYNPNGDIVNYMSQNELDNLLRLYDFSSTYVQRLLDPVLLRLKKQMYSSPDVSEELSAAV